MTPREFGEGTFGSGLFGADVATEVPKPRVFVPREIVSAGFARASLIQVLDSGEVVAVLGSATDGDVSLDASSAVRGACNLSIVDDGALGLVPREAGELLTPYGNELRIWMGVELAGRVELVSQGIYRITNARVEDTGDSLTIALAGLDRAVKFEEDKFEDDYQVASGALASEAIAEILMSTDPEVEMDFTETSITLPGITESADTSKWSLAQGIATAIGAELYFDFDGVCVLRPVPTAQGEPFRFIEEGDGGVLLRAAKDWTDDDVRNKVIVPVEGPSGELARGEAIDDDPNSPTYYYGKFGPRPYRYPDSRFITTAAQANDAAEGILQSILGVGQQIEFDAIVDPALEPSDVIQVTRERAGISAERHVLDQLSKPLGVEGSMSGSTRRTLEFT